MADGRTQARDSASGSPSAGGARLRLSGGRLLGADCGVPRGPQASRALVMLLPTPPLPDTTPMTFLTRLCGLGASCWGAASREEQAALQLEQSWVHSSLILFLRTAGAGRLPCASSLIRIRLQRPPLYYTIKVRGKQPAAPLCFCISCSAASYAGTGTFRQEVRHAAELFEKCGAAHRFR